MKSLFNTLLVTAGCLCLFACSSPAIKAVETDNAIDLDNTQKVQQALHSHYQNWRGTPYRMGGTSKSGIDCSGFVQLTFAQRLGLLVPRTTELLANTGTTVSSSDLRPGDLVFFKTAFKTRHVGIYMGDQHFLHASTSRGVITSSLNNPYWQDAFWKAQRLSD